MLRQMSCPIMHTLSPPPPSITSSPPLPYSPDPYVDVGMLHQMSCPIMHPPPPPQYYLPTPPPPLPYSPDPYVDVGMLHQMSCPIMHTPSPPRVTSPPPPPPPILTRSLCRCGYASSDVMYPLFLTSHSVNFCRIGAILKYNTMNDYVQLSVMTPMHPPPPPRCHTPSPLCIYNLHLHDGVAGILRSLPNHYHDTLT